MGTPVGAEVVLAFMDANLVYGDNVRMVQVGGRLGLGVEAR